MSASDPAALPHPSLTEPKPRKPLDARYAATLLKHWRSILALTLVGAIAGVGMTFLITPQYTSTSRLFFVVQNGKTATDLNAGSTYAERQVASFARLTKEPLVIDSVRRQTGFGGSTAQLQRKVSTKVEPDTVMLTISVSDPDPQQAALLANSLANELASTVRDITPKSEGADTIKATVTTQASPASSPSSPNQLQYALIGAMIGALLSSLLWLGRETFNSRLRDGEDLARITDKSLIGEIPFARDMGEHDTLAVAANSETPMAEAMRTMVAKMRFSLRKRDSANVVMVTSSIPAEGKSTLSANIAAAMSESGWSTLLVDCDLRRPSVAEYLGLNAYSGLTSVLIGDAEIEDVIQHIPDSDMDIIPSGPVPPNVTELISSDEMAAFIEKAKETYEYIILDTPPVLPVADSLTLSEYADAVVVVSNAQGTRTHQLRKAIEALEAVRANVIGVAINKMKVSKDTYYGQYTYHRYDQEASTESAPRRVAAKPSRAWQHSHTGVSGDGAIAL